MVLSAISIGATITGMITAKHIFDSASYAVVRFNCTGTNVLHLPPECRNKVIQIRDKFAVLLGLSNMQTIEMLRPVTIPDGFKVTMHIHLNYIYSRDIDYKLLIEEAFRKGRVAEICKSAWHLKSLPGDLSVDLCSIYCVTNGLIFHLDYVSLVHSKQMYLIWNFSWRNRKRDCEIR